MDNSSSSSSHQPPESGSERLPQAKPSFDKPQPVAKPAARPYADPAGPDDLRASDADRERVAEALRDAYAEGRLDAEEHAERLEAAYAAKTMGELVPLTKDLPVSGRPTPTPAPAPAQPQPEPFVGTTTDHAIAVFGGAQRKGRFRTRGLLTAVAVFGGVEIDLSDAVIEGPELVINAWTVFGGIDITVPATASVRGGGVAVFGGFDVQEEESQTPGGPVVTIRGGAIFGGVSARHKKPKLKDRLRKQLGSD
ncbi:DUF1707 domain-containing protein [Streptacidiphilus sp. MAP5-3]|uniref:DUF1707 SHOCT-like domain-containing protein n=1 Tax=unclassified Streptacidiphilus TaxID=2643834 RepID=UPI0035152008